jgi:hypothetical protein
MKKVIHSVDQRKNYHSSITSGALGIQSIIIGANPLSKTAKEEIKMAEEAKDATDLGEYGKIPNKSVRNKDKLMINKDIKNVSQPISGVIGESMFSERDRKKKDENVHSVSKLYQELDAFEQDPTSKRNEEYQDPLAEIPASYDQEAPSKAEKDDLKLPSIADSAGSAVKEESEQPVRAGSPTKYKYDEYDNMTTQQVANLMNIVNAGK